jgi:hypothetical protein
MPSAVFCEKDCPAGLVADNEDSQRKKKMSGVSEV